MNSLDLLSSLVSIGSVSGKEDQIIKFIYSWLSNCGLKPIIENNNLIVYIKGKLSEKALVFNSHVDTVSAGELSQWSHDPMHPFLVGNKLFGLGTSDTKGGVASTMMLSTQLIKEMPSCDVYFSFVVREELDGLGTKQFVNWFTGNKNYKKYKDVSAIVCEPTSLKSMEISHKGNAFIKVFVKGQTGHGSRPWLIKKHAIWEAWKIIESIEAQIKKWQGKYSDSMIGSPSIGLTGINSGSTNSPNKFPGTCTLQLDIRTTPKFHPKLDLEIKEWLSKFNVDYKYMVKPAPFGWCSKDEKIVKVIKDVIPNIEIFSSDGATDQCFFSQKGIPTVIFGPGEKEQSHKLNEYCYPQQIFQAVEIYKKIIKKWV